MVITSTSVAFVLLSLGLGVCGWWFLKAFRKSGGMKNDSQIGLLLSLFFLGFSFHSAMLAFGALFLLNHPEAFYFLLILNHFVLGLLAILGVYMSYHIFWPSKSSRLGVCAISMVGGLAILTTIAAHPHPFVIPHYGVDFNLGPALSSLVWCLFIASIGTPLYLFSRLFMSTPSRELRGLSLLIALLATLGIINVSVRLLMFINLPTFLRTRLFDVGVGLVGFFFVASLVIFPLSKKMFSRYFKNESKR